MEAERIDGRTANQLRPLACSHNILNRAHGSASWSQGILFFCSILIYYLSSSLFICLFIQETLKSLLLFMDQKLEQRRTKTLRRLALKLFGSLRQAKLVISLSLSFYTCFLLQHLKIFLSILTWVVHQILKSLFQNVPFMVIFSTSTNLMSFELGQNLSTFPLCV